MYDDFLARILEPDIFLPSQFYGTKGLPRTLEGEKRLMIAILPSVSKSSLSSSCSKSC